MLCDIEEFNIPNRFIPSNDFYQRSTHLHNYSVCDSFNSLFIRSLATSIHRDIYQLCDEQSPQECHSNRRYISHGSNTSKQMYKILEKISILNRKVVNLEKTINKEMKNTYFYDSQNFNYKTICNSTKSLINITTSLKYDLLNECRPHKPISCHRPVRNVSSGVPDVVEKIMTLENQLFELLTDIECKLQKEKCKLNLHTDRLPSINYKNQQKCFKTSQKSAVYISCTCPICVDKKDVTNAKFIPQCVRHDDPYEKKKFHQKSNLICYSNSFNNDKDICKYPVSFIYIKKKTSGKCGCTSCECNRKHKIKCQKIKTCLSVSDASTCTCDSCVNVVRCTSSTRFDTRKIITKCRGKQKVKNKKTWHKSCISVEKSSGLLNMRKSPSAARVYPKVKKREAPKSCLKVVKSKSSVLIDVSKSASNKTIRIRDKVKLKVSSKLSITKSHSSGIFATQKSGKRVCTKSKKTKPKKICYRNKSNKSYISVNKSDSVPIIHTKDMYDKCKKRRPKKESCSILTCCSIFKSDSSISVVCDSKERPIFRRLGLYKDHCHDCCLPCLPEKSYPCVKKVYINKQTRKTSKLKAKKPSKTVDVKDSHVQVDPVTNDRGVDPVEELLPSKDTPVSKRRFNPLTAEQAVNVDTIKKVVKRNVTTTASDAFRPETVTKGTLKKSPEQKQTETNTDIIQIVSRHASVIEFPEDKPVMVDKVTSQEEIILKQAAAMTDVKQTREQKLSTVPPDVAHKDVLVKTLDEPKKPEVLQTGTNTDLLEVLHVKTGTSITEVKEKGTTALIQQKTEDKVTNTDKHIFIEKGVNVSIREKTSDKVTNTQKREYIEKEITASIKQETTDRKTSTNTSKFVEKYVNTEVIETPKKETFEKQTETDKTEEIKRESKENGEDITFRHSITRYICRPCDHTHLHTRSSIHKLPSAKNREKYDARLETDCLKVLDCEDSVPVPCNPETCCYCQYNLEKEYQQILEKKCEELLKRKGYRLIKEKKAKHRKRPSYNSSVYNKSNKYKKYSPKKHHSPPYKSDSDFSCEVIGMESITIIKKPSSNMKNYKRGKNDNDMSTSSEGQKIIQDKVDKQNKEDNQNTENRKENNKKKNILSNSANGKKLMHLTYSSKSSIQILLPSGAELYEEEDKSAAKQTRKISIRKKDHSPDTSRESVGDKTRYNTQWKAIVDKLSNNFENSRVKYSELFSDSSGSSRNEEYSISSGRYSSDTSTSSFDSDHRRWK